MITVAVLLLPALGALLYALGRVVDQAIGSAAGLQAGRRAGARCFAVGRAARTPALSRLAERTVEDLAQAPVVGPAEASRRRAGTGAGAAG